MISALAGRKVFNLIGAQLGTGAAGVLPSGNNHIAGRADLEATLRVERSGFGVGVVASCPAHITASQH